MSSYSQTLLHGEATVPDRHSRVQEGQRPPPHHHRRPTQRPQVGCSSAPTHRHTHYTLIHNKHTEATNPVLSTITV